MTRQERRKRRLMRRRIVSLVTLCAIVATVVLLVSALTKATERDAQQPDAVAEKTSAVIPTPPAIPTAQPPAASPVERDAEQPEQAQEEAQPEEISRYADLDISEEDIELLAALAYHEARGECFDGQVAVIEVVLNRCLSPEFPDTVEGVVFQKYGDVWQFSPAPYIWTAEPTQTQYDAVYTAIESTDYILPVETVFFSREAYNEHVVATIGNHVFCSIEEVTQ